MEKLKMSIRHVMLWEFKNNKNAKETTKKFVMSLLSAMSETGFHSFVLVIYHWQMNPDQDALQQISIKIF